MNAGDRFEARSGQMGVRWASAPSNSPALGPRSLRPAPTPDRRLRGPSSGSPHVQRRSPALFPRHRRSRICSPSLKALGAVHSRDLWAARDTVKHDLVSRSTSAWTLRPGFLRGPAEGGYFPRSRSPEGSIHRGTDWCCPRSRAMGTARCSPGGGAPGGQAQNGSGGRSAEACIRPLEPRPVALRADSSHRVERPT